MLSFWIVLVVGLAGIVLVARHESGGDAGDQIAGELAKVLLIGLLVLTIGTVGLVTAWHHLRYVG
jgi:hypothetical protein